MTTPPFKFTLGPFETGPKIGEGDMGTVYQATHSATGETVALKVLDKVDVGRKMDREAAAEVLEFAAGLKHEYLHPITHVVQTDDGMGMLGLAMPIASGRSLGNHLDRGRKIPVKHALKIISNVAEALHFLHQQEVAHGAIKPTNILLDANANPTLSDLPMAHLRDFGLVPETGPTLLQQFYMPAEQVYNATPEIRGDIFSLAVLTYHMLTGELPFDDPEPEARKLSEQRDLPAAVYYVLLRGMTQRLRMRYSSIKAFMEDFQGARRGQIDPETERWFKVEDGELPEEEDEEE